jgi:DMSO/TMAO reductase YedYZ molybdopterin-dependent catalytic subunit
MKKHDLWIGALLGGVTALVVAALSELGNILFGLPGIAFSLFDWMTRHLPGSIISLFISTMVSVISNLKLGATDLAAKRIEQGSAILIFIIIGLIFGLVLAAFGRRHPEKLPTYGIRGGIILLVLMFALLISLTFQSASIIASAIWLAVLFIGWGWLLGMAIQYITWPAETQITDPSRRRFLYLVGAGSFTVLVSTVGASLISENNSVPATGAATGAATDKTVLDSAAATSGPAKSPPAQALAGRFPAVPGTRAELTDNKDFYRVDINTIPPQVDANQWRLEVKGLVNHPMQLTLDEIQSRPSLSQVATLECISNDVGGDLTSTSLWTGVPLKDILAEAGLKPGAKEVYIRAADGFYESVPIAEAMDERTMLVYQMNGVTLPVEHGFPLRIYIPNHFGMKMPKWITSLEVIDHEATGYWVDRGWSQTAVPPTTSVIDVVATNIYDSKTGLMPVGGIAYAGARGISKVEVQVDNGPWTPAELRNPPLSPLTWVQWRYFWKAQIGRHTFRVRAYDGTGQLQPVEPAPPAPNGATGIDTFTSVSAEGLPGSTN